MKMKRNTITFFLICITLLALTSCATISSNKSQDDFMCNWVNNANLDGQESPEELYEAALKENTLVIYSVTSRLFDTKKAFEESYPGLTVEIKDIRGNDAIRMVKSNYENQNYICDIIICSDNEGSLYSDLIQPGIIYPYIPWDIKSNIKDGHMTGRLDFLDEAIMIFYNNTLSETPPITKIGRAHV